MCTRCGVVPSHGRNMCPALHSKCRGCGATGHWVKCCRAAQKYVHEVADRDDNFLGTIDVEHLGAVDSETSASLPWTILLKVRQVQIRFKIDTGADVTVISEAVYGQLGNPPLTKCTKKLFGPGKKQLNVIGSLTETVINNSETAVEQIYVVKGLDRCLLGRPAILKLGLLEFKYVNNLNEVICQKSVEKRHPNLFRELGVLSGEYSISLKEGAKPYALTVPRRVPIPLLPRVKQEIESMEKNGVIFRVDEPTDWCAGMVVVPKQNDKIRVCVDLTKLNESVKRENFPLPNIDQSLGLLAGAKYFTKLDAKTNFWQVKLSDDCKLLTTFITPFGRFAFNRLSFGIYSPSEYFQTRMFQILKGTEGVICETNDVLVFGRTECEHDERLNIVLFRLEQANLSLNSAKCEFKKNSR